MLITRFNRRPAAAFGAVVGAMAVGLPLLMAFSNLPPVRSSGAPSENTCANCHSGAGAGAATVSVAFPGTITYVPGVKQRLRVTVSEAGKVRWGFQLSARLASDASQQAGDLTPVDALTAVRCNDASTKTATGCPTGALLQFAEQTSAGSQAGTASSAFWDIDWTPPATAVGNIQIFVAGLAANGNGNTGGDDTATVSYMLAPTTAPATSTLTVTPTALSFAATAGGGAPAAQTFHVASSGASLAFTTGATTVNGGNWLQVVPQGGNTPMDVSVSVVPDALQAGTYLGSVSVASAGVSNSPKTVAVTLVLSPVSGPPVITLAPATLLFTLPSGGAAAAQSAQLNSTTSGIAFSTTVATTDGGGWLAATPASGTTPSAVVATLNPNSLAPGTYTGSISVTAPTSSNSPQTLAISLTVTGPALTVTPASLSFNSPSGGAVASQIILVSSSGTPVTIAAAAATNSGGNWLSVTPNGTTPASLSVSVNAAGMAAGTFTGSVSISSAGASNSPRAVAVKLVVGTTVLAPTDADLTFRFNVLDQQSGGTDRMLLSGTGAIAGGVLSGSGDFNRFTPTSSDRNITVSTGTWTATGLVSFTPASGNSRGGNRNGDDAVFKLEDDGGHGHGNGNSGDGDNNNNGGILIIGISLLPAGGSAVPATLRIANTGSDFGVTLTFTGGPTFTPTGTGNVTIDTANNNNNDNGDGGGHDGPDAVRPRK